jgi:hypothetical protein
MDIKNIIIFLVIFLLILWLQHNDDKKFNKVDQRISLYDKIKIPLVSALLVILIKELDLNNCVNYIQSVLIIKPVAESSINSGSNMLPITRPIGSNMLPPIGSNMLPAIGSSSNMLPAINSGSNNVLNDIYIGPPDF